MEQINEKISVKVNEGKSSWIDWQFIVEAAAQLTKVCTLEHVVCPGGSFVSNLFAFVFTVPIHTQVHISICLLHGVRPQEDSGECTCLEGDWVSVHRWFVLGQFEYQQAQLEREIENLSWKVERTDLDSEDVADLQQQMRVTEVQRQNLLRDFFH